MSVTTSFFHVVSKVSRTISKMDIYKMSVFLDVFGLLRLHSYTHILSKVTRYYMLGFSVTIHICVRWVVRIRLFIVFKPNIFGDSLTFQTEYFRRITDFSAFGRPSKIRQFYINRSVVILLYFPISKNGHF